MTSKKILSYLLDLILPRSKNLRALEEMTPEKFLTVTGQNQNADFATENAIVKFDYKHPFVRQAIWELKYRGNKKVAKLFAECLYEDLVMEIAERKNFEKFDKPILVPIPLSKKRFRERGFNQCELLADALEAVDRENFFEIGQNVLAKVKETDSQTKKNRAERLKNLKNCFAVPRPEKISGRNIILLDDVITTGATLNEARRTLKRLGARKVLCVAIAH